MFNTYNSKSNREGNRLNLVINHHTKELYFHTCNTFNLGNTKNEMLQRDIKRIYNDAINDGYLEVKHQTAKNWNNEKVEFINNLIDTFKDEILTKLNKTPTSWNNKDIREYIQQKVENDFFAWSSYRTKEQKKKIKNDIIVNNL